MQNKKIIAKIEKILHARRRRLTGEGGGALLIKLFFGFLIFLASVCPGTAQASMIYFDDLTTEVPVPAGYQGFTWSAADQGYYTWWLMDNSYYRTVMKNTFDFPSNPMAAYISDPSSATISRAAPFDFISAYIGTGTKNDNEYYSGPATLIVTGKLGDQVVGSRGLSLTPGALTLWTFNFTGVDQIVFQPSGGAGSTWLIDNIDYSPSNVPLSPSLVLMGSGLLWLWGRKRRPPRI